MSPVVPVLCGACSRPRVVSTSLVEKVCVRGPNAGIRPEKTALTRRARIRAFAGCVRDQPALCDVFGRRRWRSSAGRCTEGGENGGSLRHSRRTPGAEVRQGYCRVGEGQSCDGEFVSAILTPSFFCTTARCRRLDPDEPVSSSVRISRRSSSAIPDQARNLHTACRVLQLFLDSSLSPAVAQRPKLHFSSRNAQVKRRRSLRSCSTRACQAAKPSPSRSLGAWRL